ncbi:TPA: hypothetical protein N0F65_007718 [Lagenidium giganteum]|uniref:RecA family profile 1 domain-containing protein n=1 Tax=Lagenidium giganteum TaxID=4803 RepID=A0AAV2Z4W4_9STRA|nr:TPA: hypothetical protein N0F65_007718 [Lagenidium giganteum]
MAASVMAGAAPMRRLRCHRSVWRPLEHLRSCLWPQLGSGTLRSFASGGGTFRCGSCGQPYAKWQGQCSHCAAWGAIAAVTSASAPYRQPNMAISAKKKAKHGGRASTSWTQSPLDVQGGVQRMNAVNAETFAERLALPDRELNWVLGGGLVMGSLTLVAGNPGVGKSTLALQIANMLSSSGDAVRDVLYVSGEESVLQVKMRATRLGVVSDNLFVASETNIDAIIDMIERRNPLEDDDNDTRPFAVVVIDSVQTVFAEDVPSAAGTVNQVKECTLRLLRLAKRRNVPVMLIGHVTKSGEIAGPKVLEHIVDTVVQLEGDAQSTRRFLRCQKNRFGNTSEVGVFTMADNGLQPLKNPLMAFVSAFGDEFNDENEIDGTSLTIAMEGSRPIPVEIQALSNRTYFHVDARSGNSGAVSSRVRAVGVSYDKLQLLLAVLEKRARVPFQNRSVFVNIAEGYSIQEPAADLALAVALASAVTSRPVIKRAMFLGEIALSGHLRPVKMLESRLVAAQKIGLDSCIIPTVHCADTRKNLPTKCSKNMQIIEAATVLDALKVALRPLPSSDSNAVDAYELQEY